MAGEKITEIAEITQVANDDLLTCVDISDTTYAADGTNKKFTKANLLKEQIEALKTGWHELPVAITYASVDNPTGVVNCAGANTFLSLGMRIKFTNGGNTIYGIITAVTSTTFTFLHEMNTNGAGTAVNLMANSAITNPSYSTQKAPFGFPTSPLSWSKTQLITHFIDHTGTDWAKLTNDTLDLPIGSWVIQGHLYLYILRNGTELTGRFGLNTSDAEPAGDWAKFTYFSWRVQGASADQRHTTYYTPTIRYTNTSSSSIYVVGRRVTAGVTVTIWPDANDPQGLTATCAYL